MISFDQIRELLNGNERDTSKFVVVLSDRKYPDYYIGYVSCLKQNSTLDEIDVWLREPQRGFIHLSGKHTPQQITLNSIDLLYDLDKGVEAKFAESGLTDEDVSTVFGFPLPQFDFREYLRRAFAIEPKHLWDYSQLYCDYYAEIFASIKAKKQEVEQ